MDRADAIRQLEHTRDFNRNMAEGMERLKTDGAKDAAKNHYDFAEALDVAIAALREQEQSNANQRNSNASNALEWVSVKEKPMPEGNEEYEVCCDYHGEKRIEIHKGWNTHCVTHWRHLPEPPKEGAEG